MTITLPKKNTEQFVKLMDALNIKFKRYLKRELCEDAKLNVVDGTLVLQINDTLPEFIKLACQMIFEETIK